MADVVKKYTLKTELKLEPILVSFNKENYKTMIDTLVNGIKDYDKDMVDQLNQYKWLVEKQLQGNTPSVEILKREFPALNFDTVVPITTDEELSDYIFMFISQKKHRFLSTQLLLLSDKVRTQGLTDDDTMKIYNYLSSSESDTDYVPITENFQELYEKQEKLVGISFLCPELDSLTGGITTGQICTILGAPGSMKTTYSSNIAYNALKTGKNVLYLSLEEPARQLFSKWLSRCSLDTRTPIPQKDIVQRNLDQKQKDILFNTVLPQFNSNEAKLYIVDEQDLPDYSLPTLESKFKEIDKLAREATGHGIDLLVVDHIQILKFAVSGLDTIATINMYTSFFRQQSLSWLHEKRQISVILLSQANREGYAYAQKTDGQYLSQHVAEASEVERASAYIISVYTDSMSQITNQLKLCAVKLRGAALPASVIPIYEDGSMYQVGNLTPDINVSTTTTEETHLSLNDINDMLGGAA